MAKIERDAPGGLGFGDGADTTGNVFAIAIEFAAELRRNGLAALLLLALEGAARNRGNRQRHRQRGDHNCAHQHEQQLVAKAHRRGAPWAGGSSQTSPRRHWPSCRSLQFFTRRLSAQVRARCAMGTTQKPRNRSRSARNAASSESSRSSGNGSRTAAARLASAASGSAEPKGSNASWASE